MNYARINGLSYSLRRATFSPRHRMSFYRLPPSLPLTITVRNAPILFRSASLTRYDDREIDLKLTFSQSQHPIVPFRLNPSNPKMPQ
jgi:hypothetical protein